MSIKTQRNVRNPELLHNGGIPRSRGQFIQTNVEKTTGSPSSSEKRVSEVLAREHDLVELGFLHCPTIRVEEAAAQPRGSSLERGKVTDEQKAGEKMPTKKERQRGRERG